MLSTVIPDGKEFVLVPFGEVELHGVTTFKVPANCVRETMAWSPGPHPIDPLPPIT